MGHQRHTTDVLQPRSKQSNTGHRHRKKPLSNMNLAKIFHLVSFGFKLGAASPLYHYFCSHDWFNIPLYVCSICLISVKVWCLLPQVIVSKRALKCPSIFLLPSFCSSMLFLQFSLFVFVLMRSLHSRLTGVHVVSPLWIRGMFCIFHHQAQIRWSVHVSPQHALMHSVEKQLIKCS